MIKLPLHCHDSQHILEAFCKENPSALVDIFIEVSKERHLFRKGYWMSFFQYVHTDVKILSAIFQHCRFFTFMELERFYEWLKMSFRKEALVDTEVILEFKSIAQFLATRIAHTEFFADDLVFEGRRVELLKRIATDFSVRPTPINNTD